MFLTDIEIEKIIVHKDYRRASCSYSNDIALVKLAKSVDFSSKYIGPACMPNPGEDYRGAKGCWVSGKGRVANKTKYPTEKFKSHCHKSFLTHNAKDSARVDNTCLLNEWLAMSG